jgi:dolichyl-phosphate-mannose-protein mannosyltransferase
LVFQLPTLYFAVLMLSHVLDHFIFSSKRYTTKTKAIIFGVLSSILLFTFWWFKGAAFGIPGPIADHKGLLWRKVCFFLFIFSIFGGIIN